MVAIEEICKRQWKYPANEVMVDMCYDCGLYYDDPGFCDVVVSNEIWELINPTVHKGGGLLCFNCMARRLAFLGLSHVSFKVASGSFHTHDS